MAEGNNGPGDGKIKAQVSQGLGEARGFAKSLDMDEVERGTEEYRITVKQNALSRTATSFGGAAVAAGGRAAGLRGRMRGKLGGAFGRKKLPEEAATVMCVGCLEEISVAHKFRPECGHSAVEANGAAT